MNQKNTKFKSFNFEKRNFAKLSCPLSHFDGFNLWLLKPTHLNRGRGIHVFNDLQTLHKLIKEYCQGKDEENLKKKSKLLISEEKDGNNYTQDELNNQTSMVDLIEPIQEENLESPSKSSPSKKDNLEGGKKQNPSYKIKHNTFII